MRHDGTTVTGIAPDLPQTGARNHDKRTILRNARERLRLLAASALALASLVCLPACSSASATHSSTRTTTQTHSSSRTQTDNNGQQNGRKSASSAFPASKMKQLNNLLQGKNGNGTEIGENGYRDPKAIDNPDSSWFQSSGPRSSEGIGEVTRDKGSFLDGDYTLTTYCLGTGNLSITLRLGQTTVKGSMACSDDIARKSFTATADKKTTRISVHLTPSAGSHSEFGYVLAHVES